MCIRDSGWIALRAEAPRASLAETAETAAAEAARAAPPAPRATAPAARHLLQRDDDGSPALARALGASSFDYASYSYSYFFEATTPAPTVTLAPTEAYAVGVTLQFSGLACADYTNAADLAVRRAIASLVTGVETGDITNGTDACTDTASPELSLIHI